MGTIKQREAAMSTHETGSANYHYAEAVYWDDSKLMWERLKQECVEQRDLDLCDQWVARSERFAEGHRIAGNIASDNDEIVFNHSWPIMQM